MLDFLQGFSYGLLLTCMPWFFLGMFNPALAVPVDPPSRWQLVLRYWIAAPAIGVMAWTTSLWGGFEPSLAGWLAGLVAIPAEVFLERKWRRWRAAVAAERFARQREAEAAKMQIILERQQRESGLRVLEVDVVPANADDTIRALVEVKRRLLAVQRPDVAIQADRLYSRYANAVDAIKQKFDPREITFERSRGLVSEVANAAVDTLSSMGALAAGIASIDVAYVRRRVERLGAHVADEERVALERRIKLVEDTEGRLRELGGRVEAALTALDDTAIAVAGIRTGPAEASGAAEQALAELRRFAETAEKYGRRV